MEYGGLGFRGYFFGGPYKTEVNILGSILGSPHFGKLPYLESRSPSNVLRNHLIRWILKIMHDFKYHIPWEI